MPIKILPRDADADEHAEPPRTERTRARHALLELANEANARGDHELAALALRVRALR